MGNCHHIAGSPYIISLDDRKPSPPRLPNTLRVGKMSIYPDSNLQVALPKKAALEYKMCHTRDK